MILSISQNPIKKNLYQPQKTPNVKNIPLEGSLTNSLVTSPYPKGVFQPFLGTPKTYSNQIQALKKDMEAFPEDIAYRKTLMANAGKNPDDYYKIRSIVGSSELKSIMKNYNENEEFYSVGIDDKNIKNKTIRANLHMHTLASDGFLSAQELLDKAAAYADEVVQKNPAFKKEPFTVAITDHDTTESTKEAIEIISKDPLKYKNLRVVLGIEFTTFNNIATNFMKTPTDNHILAYGIDPNEKTFSKFVDDTKQSKHKIASKIVNQANKTYQKSFNTKNDLLSLDEVADFYNPVRKNLIGIFNYVKSYINTKIILKEVVLKNPELIEKMKQKNLPIKADECMKEMKDFYYQVDKNNKSRGGLETISMFLSQKLDMQKPEIEELIKTTPNLEKYNNFNDNIKNNLEQYKVTFNPKYHYLPTIKDVFGSIKNQDNAIVGIAHPLDRTVGVEDLNQKYEYLTDFYNKFKQAGGEKAVFSEVYYQSYADGLKTFKETDKTKNFLNKLSEDLNLYKTGSADSHRKNIFKRFD